MTASITLLLWKFDECRKYIYRQILYKFNLPKRLFSNMVEKHFPSSAPRAVVVKTAAQLYSAKSELRFCAGAHAFRQFIICKNNSSSS